MRIRKVELRHFRQFYGEQRVEFATDRKCNVTLIHAENGFGKTTLLNSILWALFEDTTEKFEDDRQLVSFAALEEGQTTASVKADFDYGGKLYMVSRRFEHPTQKTTMDVVAIDDGVHKALRTPDAFITSVVPREMARYFFFDGEAAEAFSSQMNHRAVGQAIRCILGCTLAETALRDLRELSNEYDKEIGVSSADAQLARHQEHLVELEERLEDLRDRIGALESERTDRKQQLAGITEKLRNLEGARKLQAERDTKEAELADVRAALRAAEGERLKWLGSRAIHVVSTRLAAQTLDFVDDASLRGKIPSPYNEDFVRTLLHDRMCICKRPLEAGTEHYAAVADMLRHASNTDTLGKVVRGRSRVMTLERDAADAPEALREIQARLAGLTTRRAMLEQEIAELGMKIESSPISEIAEREKARAALEHNITKLIEEIGGAKVLLEKLEGKIAEAKRETERITRTNEKAQRVLRRRKLVDDSRALLEAMLRTYEDEARESIKEKVDAILGEVAHRDYLCDLGEDFALRLQMRSGHGIPKSGGENQLLSLVFIGALVQFAASRLGDKNVVLRPGTVAPLVLDAPLGQLDMDYQEAVAQYLPKLAEQVVLLLSSSQCPPRVLDALEPRIGAEYVLISENVEPRGSRADSRLMIGSKEYVCSEFGRPRQMTRIERIR